MAQTRGEHSSAEKDKLIYLDNESQTHFVAFTS